MKDNKQRETYCTCLGCPADTDGVICDYCCPCDGYFMRIKNDKALQKIKEFDEKIQNVNQD